MGAWSVSINGNDTAADLLSEYTCAFYKYGVDEGVKRLDKYVRTMFDESDSGEWSDYVYSLANFMWKKGILTEDIKNRAVRMIDSGFGLENWEEAGEKMLKERKKVLNKLRLKLQTPMCAPKKIRPNVYMNEIFDNGDIIAVRLVTKGKVYSRKAEYDKEMPAEEFHSCDGKYILIQKICTECSWRSSVVPEIGDKWAVFRLFDGVYDEIPEDIDTDKLKPAFFPKDESFYTPFFDCESTMFYFKKRGYKVICHEDISGDEQAEKYDLSSFSGKAHISFGVCNDWNDADSDILSAMDNKIVTEKYTGDIEIIEDIIRSCVRYEVYDPDMSSEENLMKSIMKSGIRDLETAMEKKEREYEENAARAIEHLHENLSKGGTIYTISYCGLIGFLTVTGKRTDDLYIKLKCRKRGFGMKLMKYAKEKTGDGAYFEMPGHLSGTQNGYLLEKLCKSADIESINERL